MFVFVFLFVLPVEPGPVPKSDPQVPLPAADGCGPDYYGTPPDCVLKDPLVRALEKENELWQRYWAEQGY